MTKLLFSGLFILSMPSVAHAYVSGGGGTFGESGNGGCFCGDVVVPFDWSGTWTVVLESAVFLAALATIALFVKTLWQRIAAPHVATGGIAATIGMLLLPDTAYAWGDSGCVACSVPAQFDWASFGQILLVASAVVTALACAAQAIRVWRPRVAVSPFTASIGALLVALLIDPGSAHAWAAGTGGEWGSGDYGAGCGACVAAIEYAVDWAVVVTLITGGGMIVATAWLASRTGRHSMPSDVHRFIQRR
jgi:hypothetical protein